MKIVITSINRLHKVQTKHTFLCSTNDVCQSGKVRYEPVCEIEKHVKNKC